VALRGPKVVSDLVQEFAIVLALEHFAQEVAALAEQASGDAKREPPQGDAPRVIERPVSA